MFVHAPSGAIAATSRDRPIATFVSRPGCRCARRWTDGDSKPCMPGTDRDEARSALDVYVHRLRSLIGAMASSLGSLDTLLFTGGVGERSAKVRALATEGLGLLDVDLDERRDAAVNADGSGPGGGVSGRVVQSREDLESARAVLTLLGRASGIRGKGAQDA